jgi:hypothetical protein
VDKVDNVVWFQVSAPVVLAGPRSIFVAGYSSTKTAMIVWSTTVLRRLRGA